MRWIVRFQGVVGALLLAVVVLGLYWPVNGYDFIAMDDNLYLVENPDIQKGLSRQGLYWAMTTLYTANWHPLTWLSLMADYEFYGLNAAGYHVSSLLLHVLNTLLLFFLLQRITGETWKSLTVAALFGIHPLNIESVAWISERKNLLSTLFLILTLHAYVRYVQSRRWVSYLLALLLFMLGLAAKPMLVTLPLVLLLLDYWPLRRTARVSPDLAETVPKSTSGQRTLWDLAKEKIPFFLFSFLSVLITLYAAKTGGAVRSFAEFTLAGRLENALVSFAAYLEKAIWPVNVAIFYPYPESRPVWKFAAACIFLTATTSFVAFKRKRHPYLVTGWLWYLITLLPVIGIVQVGFQSMANRYAYVPLIGIFLMITWGVPELLKMPMHRKYLAISAVALLSIFLFSTRVQLPYWRNSEAVFQNAIRVTEDNYIAYSGLGDVWQIRGDLRMARLCYQECLRIQPYYTEARNNLAVVLMREGRASEAEAEFRKVLKQRPDLAEAHSNLGAVLIRREKYEEAAAHFTRALELKPGSAVAKENLAKLIKDRKIGIQR